MLRDLLDAYAVPGSRFDEMLAAPGVPRPHWDAFLRSLAAREGPEIGDTLSLMEREIRENGITYSQLIRGLKAAGITLDRKMLADMAITETAAFAKVASQAKAALPAPAA